MSDALDLKTQGEKVDALFSLYAAKDVLAKDMSALEDSIKDLEMTLLKTLEEHGLQSLKTDRGTVYLKSEVYPKIVDFEEVLKFAYTEGVSSMIQKRLSSTAFKDYFEAHGEFPPGTDGTFGNKLARQKAR